MDPVLRILRSIDTLLINIRDNSENTEQGIENGKALLDELIWNLKMMKKEKCYIDSL